MDDNIKIIDHTPFEGFCVNCEETKQVFGEFLFYIEINDEMLDVRGALCQECYEMIFRSY